MNGLSIFVTLSYRLPLFHSYAMTVFFDRNVKMLDCKQLELLPTVSVTAMRQRQAMAITQPRPGPKGLSSEPFGLRSGLSDGHYLLDELGKRLSARQVLLQNCKHP